MLKLGHKYATAPHLKDSLTDLIEACHTKYHKTFNNLSAIERTNWDGWRRRTLNWVSKLDEPRRQRTDMVVRCGIKQLREMDIVLKQADKNLGLVAIKTSIYNRLLDSHINSPSFKKVERFPHDDILRRLRNILSLCPIRQGKKEQWIEHATNSREANPFYIIPKIHKPQLSSRPITAQHSYMLAPLSRELAHVLQKYVDEISTIARDSKQVIQQLEQFYCREEFVMVTYDVEKLYPSIDLKDAISTLSHNIEELRENNYFWTKILQLIMFNNYVTANHRTYRQMLGTATGTQVAPPFANLYLHFKFKRILSREGILFQSRYIDDGLLMACNEDLDRTLIRQMNAVSNLRITFDISPHKAIYLDLEVYKGTRFISEGRIDIKPYFKPTNRLLYLPFTSNHPLAHKTGVIKGEAVRLLRASTDITTWLESIHFVFKGLMARGYPPLLLKRVLRTIRFDMRHDFILEKKPSNLPEGRIVLCRYHPNLRAHWNHLNRLHPVRRLLLMRRKGLTQKQGNLLQAWPPTVIWHSFDKIGRRLIAARQITDKQSVQMNGPENIFK